MVHAEREAAKRRVLADAVEAGHDLPRSANGIPCPKCNGYSESVESTQDEIAAFDCIGQFGCCVRSFVCRLCKTRTVGSAEAPEME